MSCYVAEARHELKAYLYSLKEQFAGIDKMKALTKEEKVNMDMCLLSLLGDEGLLGRDINYAKLIIHLLLSFSVVFHRLQRHYVTLTFLNKYKILTVF